MEEIIVRNPGRFETFLNYLIRLVYKMHTKILSLNDRYEASFSDKELHFIVVGIVGVALLMLVYPIMKYLARKHLDIINAWVYVFTVLLSVTLLIEIGQKISGTGDMEFYDIVAGLLGFIVFSFILIFFLLILKGIFRLFKKSGE